MRFVLFDRILDFEKGSRVVLLKNVTRSEDFFIDHFPGFPIVPGSILLGAFEQGGAILIAASSDFSVRPVLNKVTRANFRNFVLPGDQVKISLEFDGVSKSRITAAAEVEGKNVANARLDYSLEEPKGNQEVLEACNRLKAFYELLNSSPVSKAWDLWGKESLG